MSVLCAASYNTGVPPSQPFTSVIAAFGCGVAIAACGGTASDSNVSGSSSPSPRVGFLQFSECMRTHGVPNFPDPSGGGGINLTSGINPAAPAFIAAKSKCKHLLPGGGPTTGPPSAKAKLDALRISQCMRRHGISGFPDPRLSLPSSPAGYKLLSDRDGVVLAVPSTINTQSPLFQQAASACGFH
jgi:hypothetical protein